jgi:hypothetical protein
VDEPYLTVFSDRSDEKCDRSLSAAFILNESSRSPVAAGKGAVASVMPPAPIGRAAFLYFSEKLIQL